MKIAITGHTAGIGQTLKNELVSRGHEVIGFSRSNGYDISNPETIRQIVELSADCDMLINNAYSRFAQTELLYAMATQWKDQHKTIVCISSSLTSRWVTEHNELGYRVCKLALENAIDHIRNMWTWPRICQVRPGTINTARSDWGRKTPSYCKNVTPDEFSNLLTNIILTDNLFIQDVWITGQVINNKQD